jgi:Calcineurin-like phosphoesterase/Fibronectin type III domain
MDNYVGRPRARRLVGFSLSTALVLVTILASTHAVRASDVVVFSDGFESGDLSAWTASRGLVAQGAVVASGVWAGRAKTTSSAGYALTTLSTPRDDVTFASGVDLLSASKTVTLLRMRPTTGKGIASLKVNLKGKLLVTNEVSATTSRSATTMSKGAWHTVVLHAAVNGSSSTIEVWLDGMFLADISGTTSLGTGQIGQLQIGSTGAVTADVAFDDIGATSLEGPPDTQPPDAPSNLVAEAPTPRAVDLAWDTASDDVGVTSYVVFRDDATIATVEAPATAYTDRTVTPDTAYTYEVAARDAAGNLSPRSTPAPVLTPPGDPLVTAAGDICPVSPTNCAGTASLVLALNPDAAITLGDNQYSDGTLAQYLASYDQEWGRFKVRTRPAPGNHEWKTENAQGYRDYFGADVQVDGGTWYSYDLGSWHLVSLDSDCGAIGGCDQGSPEYSWLQQDLTADDHACTIAYWHHPLFTSDDTQKGNTAVTPLWELLEADGAEIVLNGHVHSYERFAPQTSLGTESATGIREIIVGTGGANTDTFGTPQPNSEVRIGGTRGVLELTLSDGGYAWRFLDVAANVLDSGTGACH